MRYLTVKEAAELAAVKPATVYSWRKRGILKPAGRREVVCADGKTRTLDVFTDADVLAAEDQTRRNLPGWGRLARRILEAQAAIERQQEAALAPPVPGPTPAERKAIRDRMARLNGM